MIMDDDGRSTTTQLGVAMEAGPTSARSGPVGRGPTVRAAVLAATLAELAEQGYAKLTIENVARRAGVHKTTVYRRWKDRESLAADALTDNVAVGVPIPDTGSIDDDLRQWARSLVEWLTSPTGRAIVAAGLSDAVRIPEIAKIQRRFFEDRFRRAVPVVTRAIARGQLPAHTDPAELIKTLVAPIYLRLLITAEPIDQTTADHAAQVALVAARAGALRPPPGQPPAVIPSTDPARDRAAGTGLTPAAAQRARGAGPPPRRPT
jgi:AcrR family transcriptional regulator